MNAKIVIVAGLLVVVFTVALWPRESGKPTDAEKADAVSSNASATSIRNKAAANAESNPRDISVHSRIAAAVNRVPPSPARLSNEELLAKLRAGEQPILPEPEDTSGMTEIDSFEDPSVERDIGLWPTSPEERIARLRAGDLPPLRDFVEGPPGKPRLREGTPKEEVLKAWGTPEHVFPAHIDERNPQFESMPPGLLPPHETDHIEYLEAWVYTSPYIPDQKSWFFDNDRLTARPYSVESYRAMLIEAAAGSILSIKALE